MPRRDTRPPLRRQLPLKLIDFSPTQLVVAIERKRNTHVEVTYALDAVEFDQVQRVVNVIFDRHG